MISEISLRQGDDTVTNSFPIVDIFNVEFAKNFSTLSSIPLDTPLGDTEGLRFNINQTKILQYLSSVQYSAPSCDDISATVLKNLLLY